MMARIISATVLAVALTAGTLSDAKPLSRIIAEMGLSPDDFKVVNATADAMLESGRPQVGAEQSWSNPESGSKGTIRVQGVRDNCVQLQHFIQPDGTDQTREVGTQRCRSADGKWILTP
ncbi:hypothetical protein [Ruegeria lacuscaerulensis]|uniref:hypothetical protein n=1 Tax=Ruegeria lacuscaerulensis TaxID=55218 RepID=UPI001F1E6182|nr:hypothetical protein [Ruegeria lacuscaerulensis]